MNRKKISIDDALLTPSALVCADLNNDGADDLALAARDSVYIITQQKDGSLAEPVKFPTAGRVRGIKTAEVNGDKINDLIIVTDNKEKPLSIIFLIMLSGIRIRGNVVLLCQHHFNALEPFFWFEPYYCW